MPLAVGARSEDAQQDADDRAVGLYLNPPERAVVLCVDEKTRTQALDRTRPSPPLKPGRAGTMTHDHQRHRPQLATQPHAACQHEAGHRAVAAEITSTGNHQSAPDSAWADGKPPGCQGCPGLLEHPGTGALRGFPTVREPGMLEVWPSAM
jgi:hypothetical protein